MNRTIYDDCAFRAQVAQSVTPMHYMLDVVKYEHCGTCRPELGIVGGTAVSRIRGNMVDLENNLLGIDRPSTLCPSFKHLPAAKGQAYVQGKEYIKPVCHPRVDVSLNHMSKCQFSSYPAIPQPPPSAPFTCPPR